MIRGCSRLAAQRNEVQIPDHSTGVPLLRVMDHDGCEVDCFSDLDDDPQWGTGCPGCRESQQAGKTPQECCR